MENDADFRILLVGRTGHGKSSTGNSIIGNDVFEVSESTRSKTKTCQWSKKYKRLGKVVEVVDTPGLFDTDLDQLAVHKELLKALLLTTPGFSVIAFVLMKGRFTDEIQKTQNLFFKWFGKDVEKFACIILTDMDSDEDKERYLTDDPHPKFKELVQTCNGNVVALNNKNNGTKKHDQIIKLFEVVEKIKRDNCDTHFSNVIFQLVESYIKNKHPNKLTKDSIRILEGFNYMQASQYQMAWLQEMLVMDTVDHDRGDFSTETDEYSTDNARSSLRKVDEDTDLDSSGTMGNLAIYDNVSNERIINTPVSKHKKSVTDSDYVALSGDFNGSFNTSHNDNVSGKSSEYSASNIDRDQIDTKQHSTYQIESDEQSALMQGSSHYQTDPKYREKKGRSRENRVIDPKSVSFVVPQSSPEDEFKDRVKNVERAEEKLFLNDIFNTSHTDNVPGRSSEYSASNIGLDQIDTKQHSTYQIESGEQSALMQGSSRSQTDPIYREKMGSSRENRVIDPKSVKFVVTQSSPVDEFKDRVNNGERVEEEMKGLLGYLKKAWLFCKGKLMILYGQIKDKVQRTLQH